MTCRCKEAPTEGENIVELQLLVEEVQLELLRDHPRQSDFFALASRTDLEELANDLRHRGQQEPIHICPDGTILRGHRRVAAAKLLGWTTIKALIRREFVDPCSDAAVAELITDNLVRQQLDDLAIARCYQELKRSGLYAASAVEAGDARDRIAARLKTGKSGRSLDRLERLLRLPRDIQDMISENRLNKFCAEKILRLSEAKREQLFGEFRAGRPVPEVLRHHGVTKPAIKKSVPELGEQLLRFLQLNLGPLSGDLEALDRLQIYGGDVVKLLDDSTHFLLAWIKRKKRLQQQAIRKSSRQIAANLPPDKLSTRAR